MNVVPSPFGYLPPMTRHCFIGACSKVGPCNNPQCGCECHSPLDQEAPR